MLHTPVVFIIYNRPDLTRVVFDSIKKIKPKKLFIIADGPKHPEEAQRCMETRKIIDHVDWGCDLSVNVAEKNMGCRKRVSTGLNWVFEQVEEAIILEDDCLPTESFYTFCETLLDYYRHDRRVMVITGDNFQDGICRTPYSYYFSKYNHCWGWATWRRAWQNWNVYEKKWKEIKSAGMIDQLFEDDVEAEYWKKIFENVFVHKRPDSWSYIWTFACWCGNGLTATPNVNMVSNIGFRKDGTHTKDERSPAANLPVHDILEVKHPPFVIRHKIADSYTFENFMGGKNFRLKNKSHNWISKRLNIKKLWKKNC